MINYKSLNLNLRGMRLELIVKVCLILFNQLELNEIKIVKDKF